jgi:predicted HicB family RNase H-like nuclease
MLSNVISYRGYHAEIKYDPSADAFHGRVLGMRHVISFYGRTPDDLRDEMKAAIEDYMAFSALTRRRLKQGLFHSISVSRPPDSSTE